MDGNREYVLPIQWDEVMEPKHSSNNVTTEEVICGLDNATYSNMTSDEIIASTDQMAAENLMFLAQDVVGYTETAELADDPSVECVTEEVITDDWVISGGQERVEVPMEHLTQPVLDLKEENDVDVPLPTDQDEYTAMRPWPCDFCSRRFRKKAALMNHMVAHQNDRPHACNLCGVRYVRKCDLMNHLKVHAFVPDNSDSMDIEQMLDHNQILKPKKKRGRRKKIPEPEEDSWENMRSARTMQWSRRGRSPIKVEPPENPLSPPSPPSPPSEPEPPPPPADPSRPFVCRHCGIGFAREKALQSHARVHGGDSPIECRECGELCWSREALVNHAAQRHPHLPPSVDNENAYESDSGDDIEYRLSPESHPSGGGGGGASGGGGGERAVYDTMRGPELFCSDCGVAFQRADLLRRHVAAAHSYKRGGVGGAGGGAGSGAGEHACDVCGATCTDALHLLAHAEGHAERAPRLKRSAKGRINTSPSSGSRQFPCRECGKVFGSRSSQQIHIRIHTGERPYACRFCWKAFADGGTLRKHERIHTGEKPYACAVCPRAFNQRVVLREHVRSHHSAPDRKANGTVVYNCFVCSRVLHSSAELVQHLIQHCDANTAMKRQPKSGPRKYKRRRKIKNEVISLARSWSGSPTARSPSPEPEAEVMRSPSPVSPPRRRRRKEPLPPPRPGPKMIHTEHPRPRTKQVTVRQRRPPRHPADDLRAIGPQPPSPKREILSPEPEQEEPDEGGPYTCEMCSMEFPRRDALLLHVPVHI